MIRRFKNCCAALVLLFYFSVGAAAQDLNSVRAKANAGDANAQFHLGLVYENGDGVPKNSAEAAKWYRKAAEQNHKYAQYNLAFLYANGEDISVNIAEVVKWMRRAADGGDADALFQMGTLYAAGKGVPQNDQQAMNWYRKAAEQGQIKAMFNLGVHYETGVGVQINNSEAVRWYRKAADQGFAPAQDNLGVMYANGLGASQNDVEAVKWYRKAAQQGDASSQYHLALKIAKGEGVPKNLVQAYSWALLSAAQGDTEGQELLTILKVLMTPEQIADAKRLSAACQDNLETCEQIAAKPKPKTDRDCSKLNQNFTLYFGSESSELTSEAKGVIIQAFETVGSASQNFDEGDCVFLPVKVTGHTDRYGSEQKNQVLSSAMAHSVADYITARFDIAYEAMTLSAKGEVEPAVVTGENEKNAQNRRVTVSLEFGKN
ncbi:MAG: OmpA family protein [Litorimonas sp.]